MVAEAIPNPESYQKRDTRHKTANLLGNLRVLRNFKIETLSVLTGVGIMAYAALSGSINNDPSFKISYSCEDNELPAHRVEGRHIQVKVVSNYRSNEDSLLIFWTPQRLSRFHPDAPFTGSAEQSFEIPEWVTVPKGTVARLRIVHSKSTDLKQSLDEGKEIYSTMVPLTCE